MIPKSYNEIHDETLKLGFNMPSDMLACSFLKTLAASKPGGSFLEMGTGTGLSTAWILDGMDKNSELISFDNDPQLLSIAKKYLEKDKRLQLQCCDGEVWLNENEQLKFDFIFADTWHGKYLMLDETLALLNKGGFYIVDDMNPAENWPEGHSEKAKAFKNKLFGMEGFVVTELNWSTGLLLAVKQY